MRFALSGEDMLPLTDLVSEEVKVTHTENDSNRVAVSAREKDFTSRRGPPCISLLKNIFFQLLLKWVPLTLC